MALSASIQHNMERNIGTDASKPVIESNAARSQPGRASNEEEAKAVPAALSPSHWIDYFPSAAAPDDGSCGELSFADPLVGKSATPKAAAARDDRSASIQHTV